MEKLTVNNVYANFLNSRTENSFANYLDIITATQFSCYISLKISYRYLACIMSLPPLYNIKYLHCLHSNNKKTSSGAAYCETGLQ